MLIDARELNHEQQLAADVCIVGAGPAGIVLAIALAQRGIDVLLIESGGTSQTASDKELLIGEDFGLPYFPIDENRYRALGGTTALWAGWCRALDELDLARRPWVPLSGWPFSIEELKPYYSLARSFCQLRNVDGACDDAKGGLLRIASNRLIHRWFDLSPPTRFGATYRRTLRQSQRIRVLLHATATEIQPHRNGQRIEAVSIATDGNHRNNIRPRTLVLAAGGIENARLMLASNSVLPNGIGNDRDLVGRCFMEHIHTQAGYFLLKVRQRFRSEHYWRFRRTIWQRLIGNRRAQVARLFLQPEVQTKEQLLNYNVMLEPIYIDNDDHRLARTCRSTRTNGFRLHHTLEQAPNRESRIGLSQQTDRFGVPLAQVCWQTMGIDARSFARSLEIVGEEFVGAGLGEVLCEDNVADGSWPPQPLQGLRGHHMGTARMSHSATEGVVDSDCRVFGFENLYVAGSSVFPTSGSSTPTFTILALSLRLAQHLADASNSQP